MATHLVVRTKPRPQAGSIVKTLCGKEVKFIEGDNSSLDVCSRCLKAFRNLDGRGVHPQKKYVSPVFHVAEFKGSVASFDSSKLLAR